MIKDRKLHQEPHFNVLKQQGVPQNTELAKFSEKLYISHSTMMKEATTMQGSIQTSKMSEHRASKSTLGGGTVSQEETAVKTMTSQVQLPNWHTMKVCLIGKAFAGKKTVAA